MEVRSIITEALSRSNVVPRRQPAPGHLVESADQLLHGLVASLNNDNYLAFTQRQIDLPARRYIHIYDEEDTLAGANNMVFETTDLLNIYQPTEEDFRNQVWAIAKDNTRVYYRVIKVGDAVQWFEVTQPDEFDSRYQMMVKYCDAYHIKVSKCNKLNTLMVKIPTTDLECVKLHFAPRDEFDRYYRNELCWTFIPLAEGEWLIETKAYAISGTQRLRLSYNEGIKFDIDSDLRIPDAYLELIIVYLTYKLAVKYPRMDDAQFQKLKNELDTMLSNVATPKADTKIVKRDFDDVTDTSYWGVIGGRYLL